MVGDPWLMPLVGYQEQELQVLAVSGGSMLGSFVPCVVKKAAGSTEKAGRLFGTYCRQCWTFFFYHVIDFNFEVWHSM